MLFAHNPDALDKRCSSAICHKGKLYLSEMKNNGLLSILSIRTRGTGKKVPQVF